LRRLIDWSEVQRYYDEGNNRNTCMVRFRFKLDAWYKAIRLGSLVAKLERQRTIDWQAVQNFYDEGNTFRQCRTRFGFAAESWRKAVRRGVLVPRTNRWPLDRILRESARMAIKRRLLADGILRNVCEECGISEWRNKPLSIQLDHRNGIKTDHRLENLRMLCPNCHSQTETFGVKNRKRKITLPNSCPFPGGVTGNTSRSEREDSRFETLPGSVSGPIV
jgi:HNH endonuclease